MQPSAANRHTGSDVWRRKAELILAEEGTTGVRNFAFDIAGVAEPEATLSVIGLLDARGATNDALAALNELCRARPDRLDIFETYGKRLKASKPSVGKALPQPAAEIPALADSEFITVIGSSYVRAFARGTRFLPFLVAPGKSLSFLTPERARITRRLTLNNIAHVDPKSAVLMVYGNGDAQNHVRNDFGTWAAVESGELPSHETVVRTAASRYFDLVREIRARVPLNLILFCAAPMLRPEINVYIDIFNEEVRKFAAAENLPLLDLTDDLRDPESGLLKPELRSADEDAHITHELVPFVERGLTKLNALPAENLEFAWDYMFRYSVDPEIETRIWSEPFIGAGNVLHSRKIMFTQIVQRATQILAGHMGAHIGASLLVLNGREGFVGLDLPKGFAREIVSLDTVESRAVMGRRALRFFGRPEIQFQTAADLAQAVEQGPAFDCVFAVLHEADDVEVSLRALTAAVAKGAKKVFVLTSQKLTERFEAIPGISAVTSVVLSNRLTTGYWTGARLFALTP